MAQKPAKLSRPAILYRDRIEYLQDGRVVPIPATSHPGSPMEEAKVSKEALEVLRKGPPVDWLILASTLPAHVTDSVARSVPLGQGEAAWRAEVKRAWPVSEEVTARHYPTTKGAQVFAMYKADVEALFAAKPSVKRIDLLPILVAHTAATLPRPGFAAFHRSRLLVLGFRSGEGLESVVESTPLQGKEVDTAFLLEHMERETYATRQTYEVLAFLASDPFPDLPLEAHYLDFASTQFPQELGWARPKEKAGILIPIAGVASLVTLSLLGYYFYLGSQIGSLQARLEALNAEANQLKQQISLAASVRRRVQDLEALLTATSPTSPLYQLLRSLARSTPDGVYISSLRLEEREARLTLYSREVPLLASAVSRYQEVLGSSPSAFRVSALDAGWNTAEVAFPVAAPAGGPPGAKEGGKP